MFIFLFVYQQVMIALLLTSVEVFILVAWSFTQPPEIYHASSPIDPTNRDKVEVFWLSWVFLVSFSAVFAIVFAINAIFSFLYLLRTVSYTISAITDQRL